MKSIRFVSLFSVFVVVILLTVLAAAQSRPVSRSGQTTAPVGVPTPPASVARQLGEVPEALPLHFANAVDYSSGGYSAWGIAVGDLNGDGRLDVVATNCPIGKDCNTTDGAVGVLLGNGDGTFQSAVEYDSGGSNPGDVAIGDLNRDGKPDVVVVNVSAYNVGVLLGNGDGTFQPPVDYGSGGNWPEGVAIADLNGDGIPDLAVANCSQSGYNCPYGGGSVGVLLGNGDGTFQTAVAYSSGGYIASSVAIGDVNGDGIPDLVVVNADALSGSYSVVGVLLGNGDGTFQPAVSYATGAYEGESVALADMNGDGHLDLVVANECLIWPTCLSGAVSVLLGNGDGTFQAPITYSSGWWSADSVVVADVNGDGKPDVIVSDLCKGEGDCNHGRVAVLVGNGDGTLQAAVTYASGGYYAYAAAVGDVNGDGRPDLLVANGCQQFACENGAVAVLLNALRAATTTKLQSSPNPSLVNQAVTFTATIASNPGIPDREIVTFYNGATKIGTGATANGIATLATSFSTAGTYKIKASYPGDAFHKASSGKEKQVVEQ